MKNTIISILCIGSASAATVTWDFNDLDGVFDSNDFGSGVTFSPVTLTSGGGTAFQAGATDGEAAVAVRNDGSASASFTVTIDSTVVVDLTSLEFVYGFDDNSGTNTLTPEYTLSSNLGSIASGASGTLPASNSANYEEEISVNASLSGLTGLTNTSVTFTWALTDLDNRSNNLTRHHFLDDIVLTGTVVPEPSSSLLISLGALGFILKRRR